MHKILTTSEGKVIIDEVILGIPVFKKMYDFYTERGVDTVLLAFSYLHFMYDPESPYIMTQEDFRQQKVEKDFKGNYNPSFDMVMVEAAEKMKELCETPTYRYLMSLKASMDKIANLLLTEDIISGKDGNLADVIRLHKEATTLIQNFNSVLSDFQKEIAKRRGNTKQAIDKNDSEEDF